MNDPAEFGKAIAARVKAYVADATSVLDARIDALEKHVDGFPALKGEDGMDGKDGKDGESIKGDPGPQGEPGKSVTVDELRPMFEAEFAKWALEVERRQGDEVRRALEKIPPPKDGLDGLGFDDLSVDYDGERRVTLKFVRGSQSKAFDIELPVTIYRGVWQAGEFKKCDRVTRGGSEWHALCDTDGIPGVSHDWKLAVKCGRDGKKGEPGRGPQGPVKL